MAMDYNGNTYRNLQEQVAYLTQVCGALSDEIETLRAQIPSKMIVEELPEEGDPLITYYVGPKGTEPDLYYEVWVWVQENPDGPFVWRELEDTDQVDLSGYLPIQDGETTLPQVYGKNEAGDQVMVNMDIAATALTIPFRDANGRTKVAAPAADGDAVNKKYSEDNFVSKDTSTTPFGKAYIKKADGTQDTLSIANTPNAGFLAQYASGGQFNVPSTPTTGTNATSKNYVDSYFIAKQTSVSTYGQSYVKNADGTQGMRDISVANTPSTIVYRDANGNVRVNVTPNNNEDAASKAYVDAAVGQLLYLHDIEIIVTVDATNKLYIKAYLINGSSTAITSIDKTTFMRMDVQYGCFGQFIGAGTPCAVIKNPTGFGHDHLDEPAPAYMYHYMSGGSLVSGATTGSMTVTFTDTVVTF